jgi:hypothetical protein
VQTVISTSTGAMNENSTAVAPLVPFKTPRTDRRKDRWEIDLKKPLKTWRARM